MVRSSAWRVVSVFVFLAAVAPLQGATYSSSQTGNWSSASTWGGSGVPGAGDTATVNGGHVVTLDTNVTVATLTLSGGQITGTNSLTVTTVFNWNSGTLSGAGTMTIASGTVGGGGTLDARTLTNNGSFTFSGGNYFYMQNNATVTNNGTIDFPSDNGGIFQSGAVGAMTITNAGTIKKSGGTLTTTIQIPITGQSGSQVLAQSGTLNIAAVAATGSTFDASGGATLEFNSNDNRSFDATCTVSGLGTIYWANGTNNVGATYNVTGVTKNAATATNIGSAITSTGDLVVAGGTLTLDNATTLSVANLSMQSGTLAGSAPITLTGSSQNWTGGTIAGTGLLTIPSGTTVTFNGYVSFDTRSISNAGNLVYTSNYYSYFYNNASLTNSGTVTFQGDGGFYIASGSPSITNSGTIEKTGGTGQGAIQVSLLAQSGSQISIQSGTMLFGTVSAAGTNLSVSSGAIAQFYYTTSASFDAASTIGGAGTVLFSAGTNSINAAYNITGATNANGGTTTIGTNNVTSVGSMTVTGGALTIDNSSAPATGTITMQGGTLTLNYASTLTIATLTMQSGTLNGTASISLTGSSMTWTGGTIGGTGSLTIPNGTSIAFNGYVYFDTRSVTNGGAWTYSSSYYSYLYNGATLTNNGTITFQGDGGFYIGSGNPSVVNNGTITKSGGTGSGSIQVSLTASSGSQLQVQSGTLLLGNVTATGAAFGVSSGATIEFYYTTSSSFDAASTVSGAGIVVFAAGTNTISGTYNITGGTKSTSGTNTIGSIISLGDLGVSGGTLTLNGASSINVPTLTMQGRTLAGTLPHSVSGASMTWSSGTIAGSGQLTIPNGTTITVSGVTLDTRALRTAGLINLISNRAFYMTNNAVLTNRGTNDLQSDAGVYLSLGASTAVVNSGTIKKSAGTSGSSFSVPLTLQSGSQLLVQASILYAGNITSTGATVSVSNGATLYFYYTASSSFDAASTINGAGTVQFGAGTNTVNAAYAVSGVTKSTSGTTTLNSITNTGDIVVNGGTLTLNGGSTLSVPTLTMQSGTLNGSAPIALTGGSMTWSGGIVAGTTTLSIPNTATVSVSGGTTYLDTRTVTNAGTINIVGTSALYMQTNAVLTNTGTIDLQGDATLGLNGAAGSTAINNNGLIKKSAGSTSGSTVNVQLDLNSGSQFQVQAGTVYFGNITATGATLTVAINAVAYTYYTTTATFDAASTISGAGTVQWYAGTNTVSGTYNITGATKCQSTTTIGTSITSTGDIVMTGGTLTLNSAGAISVPTLTMNGGTLAGNAPINITGSAMTWTGGIVGGTGLMTIPNTTTTTINGGCTIDTRTVNNAGPMNFTGGSYMYFQTNAVLNNSGIIDIQGDGGLYQSGAIGTTTVNNSGTIKKSGGASGSTFSVPITLQSGGQFLIQASIAYLGNITSTGGTLNAASGTTAYFYYTTAATFDSASTISGTGTLQNGAGTNSIAGNVTTPILMSGGTLSINSATTQSVPTLTMQGGTLSGSGTLAVTGAAMTWTGGIVGGTGTLSIPNASVVTVSGVVYLDNRTLTNAGTITFTGGNYLYLQNNAVLNNSGTIDFPGDSAIYLSGAAGTTMVNDSGTIKKSAGTTSYFTAPLTLQSGGQFLVQSGTVYFGNITGSGGTLNISSGAVAYLYYTTAAAFDASTTISGAGTLQNGAGTNSIAGTTTSPLNVSGGTLSINSAATQSIPVLTMSGGTLNGTDNLAFT
jgi:fibronectin-binding autotransporter adhesin